MRVNGDRLNQSLAELAKIGATPGGGVSRLALTDEDREGRDLVRRWMEQAGLTVRVDDFGSMTGRRPGREDGPAVLLGSHCDSVRNGGRYDGALGVLGALEVVRTLNDHGVETGRPIEVVNWTNEEGARFEPAMMASGALAGVFTRDYVYGRSDEAGRSFGAELERIGYLGREADRPGPAAAYLELHIEQGPVLEAEDLPLGVVEGIVGITWLDVALSGQAAHAGPTPMPLRHDALVAASQVIAGVQRLAREQGEPTVGTVGRLALVPNIINVIPGEVTFSVDLRHSDAGVLDALVDRLQRLVSEAADAQGVSARVERFWTSEPTAFHPTALAAVQDAVDALGLPHRRLWSAAGHDAKYLAQMAPTAMIFVRSRGGISHNEAEHSTPDDIEAGANTLLLAALELAGD